MHALVTADTVGGVWMYARELVTGLVRSGVRVTLVSFGEIPSPQQMEWMDELDDLDFRPTGFHLEWMQDAERDLELSSEYLLSLIGEVKPDILHLNQYAYGALDVDVPKVLVAHSDVVSWWVAVHGEEPPDSAWMRWYRETVSSGIAGATAVVAPSRWMLEELQRYLACPAQSSVIYNGRTPTLFNPHVTKEQKAVSVGRLWDAGKQVSLLTQIEPPMPVFVAGAEQHPESTGGEPARLRRKNLHFKGMLTEAQLRQLYSRAGVYVAISRYEPFGLAPLEAALSRCALVMNDIPTFREVWGDNAYYFHQNDAESLADALERFRTDRELRIGYANLAYRHARQHYTAERMVRQYVSLYHSLVTAEVRAA